MFAKFKQWFCSKVCQPKHDAAQIRDDLADIINDIDGDSVEFNPRKFDSVMRDLYNDDPRNFENSKFLSASEINAWLYGAKSKK